MEMLATQARGLFRQACRCVYAGWNILQTCGGLHGKGPELDES